MLRLFCDGMQMNDSRIIKGVSCQTFEFVTNLTIQPFNHPTSPGAHIRFVSGYEDPPWSTSPDFILKPSGQAWNLSCTAPALLQLLLGLRMILKLQHWTFEDWKELMANFDPHRLYPSPRMARDVHVTAACADALGSHRVTSLEIQKFIQFQAVQKESLKVQVFSPERRRSLPPIRRGWEHRPGSYPGCGKPHCSTVIHIWGVSKTKPKYMSKRIKYLSKQSYAETKFWVCFNMSQYPVPKVNPSQCTWGLCCWFRVEVGDLQGFEWRAGREQRGTEWNNSAIASHETWHLIFTSYLGSLNQQGEHTRCLGTMSIWHVNATKWVDAKSACQGTKKESMKRILCLKANPINAEIAVSATVFINLINLMATSALGQARAWWAQSSKDGTKWNCCSSFSKVPPTNRGNDVVSVQKITNTSQQATKPHLLKRHQHRKCFALQMLWHQHRFEHMSIPQSTCTVAPV